MPEERLAQIFGQVVRDWRVERGYSQEEFAYRCEIHRTYMTHIERGSKNPTLAVLGKIGRGLGVELSTIWIEVERRGGTMSNVTDPPVPR